jgi:hypothetical protein
MRRLVAALVMTAVGGVPLLAEGPMTRAIAREASRLVVELPDSVPYADWRAVRALKPGTHVVIATADTLVTGRLLSAAPGEIAVDQDGVVQRVRIDEVQAVERHGRRGSAAATGLAAAGGLLLGSILASEIGFNVRCQPNCGGVEAAMFGAVIGIPIAAGYAAWRATSHVAAEVIYRRPPRQP